MDVGLIFLLFFFSLLPLIRGNPVFFLPHSEHKITYAGCSVFLAFSLCRQSQMLEKKTRITEAARRPASSSCDACDVEAYPVIKDPPIHIHDRNLVISEHPHPMHIFTRTHTCMTHTPAALMNIYVRGPANKDSGGARALSINTGSRV